MLAGAGAAHGQGPGHQLVVQGFGGDAFFGDVGVQQVAEVEVAVAHMAHQKVRQAAGFGFIHRFEQAVCQAADGHAGVGADGFAAGAALHGGKVGVVPRRPQPGALFGGAGPFKGIAAKFTGDVLHGFGLLLHAGGRAVELHQQHGFFAQGELAVRVDHAHAVAVDQLHARNRHAQLNDLDGGAHGRFNAGEGADGGAHRLGQGVQAHRHFGDHAERAFAAHHQAREVVARAALFGARAGADDFAAGGDHFQRQHVLAHGAVAHGVGAAGARGAHAANAGVGAGVDGEEQAGVLDGLVQLLARDARLHRHREVVRVDAEHPVHAAHVDADAALHGQQVAFERGTRAVRNHRHFVLAGQLHGVGHILGAFSKHHGAGRGRLQRALVAPVLFAHGLGGGALRAKAGLQRINERLGHVAQLDLREQVGSGGGGVHRCLQGQWASGIDSRMAAASLQGRPPCPTQRAPAHWRGQGALRLPTTGDRGRALKTWRPLQTPRARASCPGSCPATGSARQSPGRSMPPGG